MLKGKQILFSRIHVMINRDKILWDFEGKNTKTEMSKPVGKKS